MRRDFFVALLSFLLLFTVVSSNGKVVAAPREPLSPNWLSVTESKVNIVISGNQGICSIVVKPKSNVKKITGSLKLDYVNSNGFTTNVAMWSIESSGKEISNKYSAVCSGQGIYQLSFSGTSYLSDGSSESISASTTKIK